jgi:hypothetical protein
MTSERIRTSLARAPSTVTEEERAERERIAERDIWFLKAKAVIDVNDTSIPAEIRRNAEALMIVRHGRREVRA